MSKMHQIEHLSPYENYFKGNIKKLELFNLFSSISHIDLVKCGGMKTWKPLPKLVTIQTESSLQY